MFVDDDSPDVGAALAISNAIAAFHKERAGRGPVAVKTRFAGPDIVVCVLHDSMTPLERTLVDGGDGELVRTLRLRINQHGRDELCAAVEQATGRPVQSLITGSNAEDDVSTKVFILGDRPGD